MKTWYLIIMQLSTWPRGSETFTSTMYLASKMRIQMHWRPSLLTWLFQPERQRKYLSTIMTCTVQNLPMKIIPIQRNSRDFSRSIAQGLTILVHRLCIVGILPDDPKEAVAIKRKAPKLYYNAIMRTLYYRSNDGILLRCVSHKEAQEALKEAHDGMCLSLIHI